MHLVMPIQIPNKKVGAHYTVSFDSPEARHIPYGESGSFPTPDLGQQCVCCNAPTDGRLVNTRPLDMSQSFVASQVPVPCCTACDDHLPIEAAATMKAVGMMFAGLLVVPLLLAAWFTQEGSPLALVAMAGVAAMNAQQRRHPRRPAHPSEQSARSPEGDATRPVQYSNQPAMAHMLRVGPRPSAPRGDCGLPLTLRSA